MIFDLRDQRGGGLNEMDPIFPQLIAKPTVMVVGDTRSIIEQRLGPRIGVKPDIETPADRALDEALPLAGVKVSSEIALARLK